MGAVVNQNSFPKKISWEYLWQKIAISNFSNNISILILVELTMRKCRIPRFLNQEGS